MLLNSLKEEPLPPQARTNAEAKAKAKAGEKRVWLYVEVNF